jgi:hypothetical protein
VRVRAANPSERPLFVGIARSADVESFLKGTAYDEVRASSTTVESITHHIGALASTPVISPGEQSIWAAASVGSGTRDMVWRAHDGQWRTVIMNADGSTQVDAMTSTSVAVQDVWPAALLILLAGVFTTVGGLVVVNQGASRQ